MCTDVTNLSLSVLGALRKLQCTLGLPPPEAEWRKSPEGHQVWSWEVY